jgi:PKD repeat protein
MKNLKTIALIAIVILAVSCKKDKSVNPNLPIANFTIADDTIPYGIGSNLVFDFTNSSSNATTYRWDFGGGYSATTTNGHIAYTTTDIVNFFTTNAVVGGDIYHSNQVKLIAKNGNDSSFIVKTIVVREEL